jgi:3-phosphoshikimate 1-carboxyvinyltransferase
MNKNKYVYPEQLEIQPVTKPVDAIIRVPGSKSITNRALVLAALSSRHHTCVLDGALRSDDTEIMIDALTRLGYLIATDWAANQIVVRSHGGELIVPAASADLYLGNSGTSVRFLSALCTLGHGYYRLDGCARMRQRPMGDLISALKQLGRDVRCENNDDSVPLIIHANQSTNYTRAIVRGDASSQFASALWLVAPYDFRLGEFEIAGQIVSEPYLEMTERMLRQWGHQPTRCGNRLGVVDGVWTDRVGRENYVIEADATSASYFLSAAALCNGQVAVPDIPDHSIQGDARFADLLGEMGASVDRSPNEIQVRGRQLRGISVDMNAISDTVMTLAAVACFAEGPTTIRNVAHIRHKECDRITALCTELRKLGVVIETYNDHRMAMSMALIGLKVPGVVIKNPGCVAKTYPGFWEDFQKLYE